MSIGVLPDGITDGIIRMVLRCQELKHEVDSSLESSSSVLENPQTRSNQRRGNSRDGWKDGEPSLVSMQDEVRKAQYVLKDGIINYLRYMISYR